MWDPNHAGADVKLPTDFIAMALTYPALLGRNNLIFPYDKEVKVKFLDYPVRLGGVRGREGWYLTKKIRNIASPAQQNDHVLVMKTKYTEVYGVTCN